MFTRIFLLSLISIWYCLSCSPNKEFILEATLAKPPVATRQLDEALFVPLGFLKGRPIKEGQPVQISINAQTTEVRIFEFTETFQKFALNYELSKTLNLSLGKKYKLKIVALDEDKSRLHTHPLTQWAETYKGDIKLWPRIAFGAPHGDCDLQTGKIVKLMTERFRIPSTAGYGGRLSYRGIWFDINRPLMKLPKPGGGTLPKRIWSSQSEAVYQMYQESVWETNEMNYGDRFELFCSFHGHDLTVKLKNGKRIERPVMEAMGVGFTKDELRRIKRFYWRNKNNYYEHPPMMVFGNLPEDRTYYYEGVPLDFFYSGLGTRVYGSLRSDLVKRALHIETPNTMRLDKKVQPQTAKFLYNLYCFITDSIMTKTSDQNPMYPAARQPDDYSKKVFIAKGSFIMGSDRKECWSSERPAHSVKLDPFKIDRYEVSNMRFSDFLNGALQQNKILYKNGYVISAADTNRIICRTNRAAPLSQLEFDEDKFKPSKGKEWFPVIFVSYYGAEMYALSRGERLPTEAEWEKAASWNTAKKVKSIYAWKSSEVEADKGNFEDSGDPFERGDQAHTTPLGWYNTQSYSGTYDMSGNVMEWCSDYYEYNYYKAEPENGWINPEGPQAGTMHTIRGGGWNLEPWISRTSFRVGVHPNSTLVNVGFRCVKS